MIRTLIVDDEAHCSNHLIHLIQKYPDTFQVLNVLDSVDQAILWLQTQTPDLVFLDIQIHNKTGFELLEQIQPITFKVVFTTAYEHFAIKAFKYSAVDYLLKPIHTDDFADLVVKLQELKSAHEIPDQIQDLLYNLKTQDPIKKITIPTSEGLIFTTIQDILYCEASASYSYIHTKHDRILVSKPLKYYEELLPEQLFFRVHNSHLVNLDHIKTYHKSGYVTMINDQIIDVSTRKKDSFLKAIQNRMPN